MAVASLEKAVASLKVAVASLEKAVASLTEAVEFRSWKSRWQGGYGIFSIGFSQVEAVRQYIAGQEEHHKKVSFQDELREFLKRYEVEFDERYVWD